ARITARLRVERAAASDNLDLSFLRRKAITCARFRPTCAENAPFRPVRNCRSGKGAIMQKGSLLRRARHSHSEVWEFRWREPGPTGTRRHRRIVVGSTDQIADESAARQAVAALQI